MAGYTLRGHKHPRSVAHRLHPDDAAAAWAWVKPNSCEVITELEQLQERWKDGTREGRTGNGLPANPPGTDGLRDGEKEGRALRERAMESTCGQYQVRFKLTGQFWSQTGAETLMYL